MANKFWLLGALSTVVLAVVLYRTHSASFDWKAFGDTLRSIHWAWLALSIVMIMLSYLGRAVRWQVMLRPLDHQATLWDLFAATIIGFTAIVILGRPGELVRPYLIALKGKVPVSSQMASWVLERIFDLFMVLLIFGFALVSVSGHEQHFGAALQWVFRAGGYFIGIICAICLALFIVFRNFSGMARERLRGASTILPERFRSRVNELLDAFLQGVQSTTSSSFVLLLTLYSVIEWAIIIACYVCLFKAFPITVALTLGQVVVFVGLVAFGAVVQIPGIGGGYQLACVLVLTEIFHVPLAPASGVASVIWVITFVVVVPFGVLLSFHEGVHWKNLRHIRKEGGL